MSQFLDFETEEMMQRGINETQQGRRANAYRIFSDALKRAPQNEIVLMWLSAVTDNIYESVRLLETVVSLNPQNVQALNALNTARVRQSEVDQLVNGFMTKSTIGRSIAGSRQSEATKVRQIGEILVAEGLISQRQLDEGLKRHQQLRQKGKKGYLGEELIRLGFITPSQLTEALKRQRREMDKGFD